MGLGWIDDGDYYSKCDDIAYCKSCGDCIGYIDDLNDYNYDTDGEYICAECLIEGLKEAIFEYGGEEWEVEVQASNVSDEEYIEKLSGILDDALEIEAMKDEIRAARAVPPERNGLEMSKYYKILQEQCKEIEKAQGV